MSSSDPHLFHGLLDNEPPAAVVYGVEANAAREGLVAPAEAYHTAHSLSSSFRGINACNGKKLISVKKLTQIT